MEKYTKRVETESSRERDPYLDRRCGDERRQLYSLDYFNQGNKDRRSNKERRHDQERRNDCFRVDTWASVCPDGD